MNINFMLIGLLLFVVSTFYLMRRLAPRGANRYWRRVGKILIFILTLSLPAYLLGRRMFGEMPVWLGGLITYSLGFLSILLSITILVDTAYLLLRKLIPVAVLTTERRDFLRTSSRLGIFGITGAIFGVAAQRALAKPSVHEVRIKIPNLPAELEGFSIAQISDVHILPFRDQENYLRDIVTEVNACQADLVAITGDIVDGNVQSLAERVAILGEMKSRYGNFFVTGNHEYYAGVDSWIAYFKTIGWHVLANEHRVINHQQQTVVVAGVHDYKAAAYVPGHRCDPAQALANAPTDAAFTLFLAHHPGTAQIADKFKIDLQLSGHTHAGQYFPGTWIVPFVHPYSQGLNRYGDMQIYVNSGTGYWGPALRTSDLVGEITLLKLTRA